MPKTISVSDLIKEIKVSTSIWLKTKDLTSFHWQTGYGIFSLSPAHFQGLCKYIANQEEHHKDIDFKDEFLGLLKKYVTIQHITKVFCHPRRKRGSSHMDVNV